jgi:hypothetical protein
MSVAFSDKHQSEARFNPFKHSHRHVLSNLLRTSVTIHVTLEDDISNISTNPLPRWHPWIELVRPVCGNPRILRRTYCQLLCVWKSFDTKIYLLGIIKFIQKCMVTGSYFVCTSHFETFVIPTYMLYAKGISHQGETLMQWGTSGSRTNLLCPRGEWCTVLSSIRHV